MAKITKAQATTKIERYLKLQALIKQASKEADALKAELKELADGTKSRTYTADAHSVSITTATRKSVDAKALAEAHPKIAAKFTKETTYDMVRIE